MPTVQGESNNTNHGDCEDDDPTSNGVATEIRDGIFNPVTTRKSFVALSPTVIAAQRIVRLILMVTVSVSADSTGQAVILLTLMRTICR